MGPRLTSLRGRVLAARDRLREAPVSQSRDLGPPDPKSGERWDRFNVLGHTAEMLPYWSEQLAGSVASGAPFGRAPGSAQRLEGIEGGRLVGEPELRQRIEAGVDVLQKFLGALEDSDLDRVVVHNVRGPLRLEEALETYLVGHLEEHCSQLAKLG